jgi:hypothetical protein
MNKGKKENVEKLGKRIKIRGFNRNWYLVARAFVFWESYFFTTELAWLIFFEFI